jgi:hypothetical protein
MLMGILLFLMFFLGIIVLYMAATWKVFSKAGQPGWASVIPVYNLYTMLKLAGKPGWWIILMIIPGLNIIFGIWTLNMISKSFGKDEGFTMGMVFLAPIFWPILGFGDAEYIGPYGDRQAFEEYQARSRFEFEQ